MKFHLKQDNNYFLVQAEVHQIRHEFLHAFPIFLKLPSIEKTLLAYSSNLHVESISFSVVKKSFFATRA